MRIKSWPGSRLKGCFNLPDTGRFLALITVILTGIFILQPGMASASGDLAKTRLEIKTFLKGPSYEFASQTADRAQAYIGAAMLAQEQHNETALNQSLEMARKKLSEARRLAADFKRKYFKLLNLRATAHETTADNNDSRLQSGEIAIHKMIQAIEEGRLNQVEQYKKQADKQYRDVIGARLPELVHETAKLIGRASAAGAKNYAPQIYSAAKEWLNDADAYLDGIGSAPEHPRQGIRLATAARNLALQVKQFRRDAGSHEQLIEKARRERLLIAGRLGIKVNADDPLADVDTESILARIDQQQSAWITAEKRHQTEISNLRKKYDNELKTRLAEQKTDLLHQQHEQMSSLKDAFRAKLERETFDMKRQQRLKRAFRKHEVDIFPNLDGSILIRLSVLKFASGRGGINKKYYDMLVRLKKALDIYSDRNINIEGHTDSQGDAKLNQVLSLKRAESVRDFLISAGVDAGRLKALGYGEVRPIASNDYEKGREMNRRIDVIIQPPPE